MMKKSIRLLLIVIMITASLSAICACNSKHEHTYKDGWEHDETYHWRIATCGDIDIGLKGLHNFVDGVCTLCGYEDPDYEPPEKADDPDLGDDETETGDPELPDDDPSSAERPKQPSGGGETSDSDEPIDPDDPDDSPQDQGDESLDDSYYDSLFYPENEYTRGNSTTEGEFSYTELSDENKSLVGYAVSLGEGKSSSGEITIPDKFKDKPVIMVDKEGFKNCTSLTKVTLPEGMLYIGESAFNGCISLNSVTIPSTLWLISKEAFSGCKTLSSIDFRNVREIRYDAFNGCAIRNLVIPNSVHTIASRAFYDCKQIAEVTFGTGVKSVGGQAFLNCGAGKVNISDLNAWCKISFVYDSSNPLNGGGKLYLNNELVTNLVIPEGCGVNKYGFSGCTSITEVTIPSSTGKIGKGAFMNCSALSTVNFKEGTNEIDSFAFGSCYNLTEIVLPDSVKYLRANAFYKCTNLKKVVLGKGLATMEYDIFPRLDSAKFYYRGSESEWQKINRHTSWAQNGGQIQFNYKD